MSIRCLVLGLGAALTLSIVGCASDPSPARNDADATSAKEPSRWVCREYNRANDKLRQRTVILQQTDKQGLKEGAKLAFNAEIYSGASVSPDVEVKGTAETEDVSFSFESDDKKVGFHIFLDEMNESGLTLAGKDAGDFVCYSGEIVCADYTRSNDRTGQRTVVLTKTEKAPLTEGRPFAFDLESYSGAKTFTDDITKGKVSTEDVMFNFTSDDGKTEFHHFMDEINEAGLTVAGKDSGDFICW